MPNVGVHHGDRSAGIEHGGNGPLERDVGKVGDLRLKPDRLATNSDLVNEYVPVVHSIFVRAVDRYLWALDTWP